MSVEILKQYQADIMLILIGICAIITVFVYLTNTMSQKRKIILMQMELSAMFLLIADRRAYIYRGDASTLGWWMVRISNFLVFFLTLAVIYSFNLYLIDLYTHEGKLETAPRRLKVVKHLALLGMALVVISQFTGFYYTFDEMNRYQRAPGFIVCYIIPLSILLLQMSVILQYYRNLSHSMRLSLLVFTAGSVVASVFQVFMYGISLNNMTIVAMTALLYVFALKDMTREVEHARNVEIESYKEAQKKEHALFEQTAEALAAAIDAKDKYTHGHSSRVAMYSTQIARECSVGFRITDAVTKIRLYSRADEGFDEAGSLPALILFDALDGRVHEDPSQNKELLYMEYGQIRFDGRTLCKAARRIETKVLDGEGNTGAAGKKSTAHYSAYEIEAVRHRDHAMIRISDGKQTVQSVVAFPDSTRFAYLSLTGEHCTISSIHVDEDAGVVPEDYIPRIAEEISYIKGCPQGDIPNLQVDGWRTQATQGVPINDRMEIAFHTQSLPTARLIWHCPFVTIFTSKDGRVGGEGYREFLLLRLDGENWESDSHVENKVEINRTGAFGGWNNWKEKNREGLDCRVSIQREGNTVAMTTENMGISLSSVTMVKDEVDELYVALTGDQCALTNIRIIKKD